MTPRYLDEREDQREQAFRRGARTTALIGIVHAVLFLLSFWLMLAPGGELRGADLERFYTDENHRRLVIAGLYVMPFAGIAFIWFSILLRSWIQGSARTIDRLFSNVQMVSAIIYVTMLFIAAAAISVIAASMEFSGYTLAPGVAALFPQLGNAIFFVFGMRMAAMFVLTTTKIVTAAGTVPTWFRFLSYPVSIFLFLSAAFNHWLIVVFPVWLILLCGLVLGDAHWLTPRSGSAPDPANQPSFGPLAGE